MHRFSGKGAGSGAVGVLDIGTSKVCCVIAMPDQDGRIGLAGLGHQRSRGVKSGMIVDAGEAERSTRAAIAQAERMAGVTLAQVHVAITCGRLHTQRFTARAGVDQGVVTDQDIARVIGGAEAYVARTGRMLIHLEHADWRLDGVGGVRDPRRLAGRDLATEVSAVTADEGPVRNLLAVIERCHLDVERLVPAPIAAAYAVTTAEDRDAGALVIDFGGGTATMAAFVDGAPVAVEAVPVGSNHMSYDIARTLVASVVEAERIKTLYGTLVKAASDASELISYPVESEEGPVLYQTSKAQIRSIIGPRVDGLFGLIAERLADSGVMALASGRVFLTGGGSQLLGLDQAWMQRFGGDVRIGRPKPLGGMPTDMCSPAMAATFGLVWSAIAAERGSAVVSHGARHGQQRGYLGRMQRWLGDGF
ncbi:MAG: cell division protein FtsA [Hyphomicrobiaceae bacterium]